LRGVQLGLIAKVCHISDIITNDLYLSGQDLIPESDLFNALTL